MTDAADREAGYVAVLEAAEDYLQCQHEVAIVLRTGFLNLARARYQMGLSKVGASQYPATMRATKRVPTNGYNARHPQDTAVSTTADDESCVGDSAVSMHKPASSAKLEEFSSSLLADLASRYASTGISDADSTADRPLGEESQQLYIKSPLQWFGVMVSPDLRQAAGDFASAVTAVERLAAAQQRLCHILAGVQSRQTRSHDVISS